MTWEDLELLAAVTAALRWGRVTAEEVTKACELPAAEIRPELRRLLAR